MRHPRLRHNRSGPACRRRGNSRPSGRNPSINSHREFSLTFAKTAAVITFVLAFTALTGCATGSQAIADPNKVAQIQPGKTTSKQVEDLLGKPGDVSLEANGEKVWTYQRVQQSWKAFVPGLNMTGDSMHEQNLTIRFDRNGVVKAVGAGEHRL